MSLGYDERMRLTIEEALVMDRVSRATVMVSGWLMKMMLSVVVAVVPMS